MCSLQRSHRHFPSYFLLRSSNVHCIVWQGDRANGMYFVEAGTLVVLKQIEGDEKKVLRTTSILFKNKIWQITQVNEIQQGGYFGELGLINHAPRQATVSAREDVKVACKDQCIVYILYRKSQLCIVYFSVLDALAFERLLGPCMEVLKRDTENYKEMLVRAFGSKVNET